MTGLSRAWGTDRTRQRAIQLASSIVGGAAFGVLDRIISHGPNWALDLSNVAAFWLAAAFVAGMATTTRRVGALLGLLCLMTALFGYYGFMYAAEHVTSLGYLWWRATPWAFAAMIVGPLFGGLGADWRLRRSRVSIIALAAAFSLDALAYAIIDTSPTMSNTIVHAAIAALGLAIGIALVGLRRHLYARPPH